MPSRGVGTFVYWSVVLVGLGFFHLQRPSMGPFHCPRLELHLGRDYGCSSDLSEDEGPTAPMGCQNTALSLPLGGFDPTSFNSEPVRSLERG